MTFNISQNMLKFLYFLVLNRVIMVIIIQGTFVNYDDTRDEHNFSTRIKTRRGFRAVESTRPDLPENPFAGKSNPNLFWVDALKDIAYYLRAHKFNEYDRRYQPDASKAPREYYGYFPRPPLRSLHWEVHKFCEESFVSCVEYLRTRVQKTGLRREDDTAIVIQQQNWTRSKQAGQINSVEQECRKMQKIDESRADPFEGRATRTN